MSNYYLESFERGIKRREQEKKEQELKDELSSLRSEIKKLKKLNMREEVNQKIKVILLTDGILEDKAREIVDYFMYLLERENKWNN